MCGHSCISNSNQGVFVSLIDLTDILSAIPDLIGDIISSPSSKKRKRSAIAKNIENIPDDNIKKYLYIVIFAVNDNGEGVMGFPIKCIYIDSNTGEILYEKAEHLDRPYSDRIPKSKTFFPQKDDKKRIEVSK